MTWGFIKYGEAQKTIENIYKVTQQSEITSEANNESESHFTDNESISYNTVDGRKETSFVEKNNVPNSNPIKTRRTFSKCKRKKSIKQAKKVLPREKEKKKLNKILLDSQSMRLCLVTHNDKKTHVNCEAAKKISRNICFSITQDVPGPSSPAKS